MQSIPDSKHDEFMANHQILTMHPGFISTFHTGLRITPTNGWESAPAKQYNSSSSKGRSLIQR